MQIISSYRRSGNVSTLATDLNFVVGYLRYGREFVDDLHEDFFVVFFWPSNDVLLTPKNGG